MATSRLGLNDKQKRFAHEYVIDFNATQAAIRTGYSKKTAYSQGHYLLKKPKVQKLIDDLKKKTVKRLEISQARTLKEMGRLGYSDIRKLYNQDGSFKPITEWDDDIAAAVSSIEYEQVREGKKMVRRISKVRLWDKNKPVEMLGKHFKIYEEIAPAPVTNNTFSINSLSASDLKKLLEIKKNVQK